MKNFVIFNFLIFCFHIAVSAQNNDTTSLKEPEKRGHTSVGLYLGVNNTYSLLSKAVKTSNALDISPEFGGYGLFDLNEKLQLEAGLGWMNAGGKNLKYGNSYNLHDTIVHEDNAILSVYYFTIPLKLKYIINPKSTVFIGARWSNLISGEVGADFWYEIKQTIIPGPGVGQSLPDRINRMDFAVLLGYEYHITEKIYISASYNVGLMPIFGNGFSDYWSRTVANGYVDATRGNYNRSLMISLSYNAW